MKKELLKQILAITERAADIPRDYFRKKLAVDSKSDDSPVTRADRETEAFIRSELTKLFPDHAIFGEEFGRTDGKSRYQWVIDPIDGTRSFISGMPLYGMLVSLLEEGQPVLGVVRMPELGEVYSGLKDSAFLNGEFRLSVSSTKELSSAFIYINEASKILRASPRVFSRLDAAGRDRRFGYDCYPHMLVAAGHIDACIDYDLQPYDFLALAPVIEGAGGVITDWNGQPVSLESDGRIVSAATQRIHSQILELLSE